MKPAQIRELVRCSACPRLRRHCEQVALKKRKAYQAENYWGKPVPPFGDAQAKLLVVGLAPGAHGANRTGRVFTGDRSGEWLYRALWKAGFANQPQSHSLDDGLSLLGARVTCVVKCAPPDNKPTPTEVKRCSSKYLKGEITEKKQIQVFLALGKLAWDELQKILAEGTPRKSFAHGAVLSLPNGQWLVGSYHPSQQNTFTGRLTEPQFDRIFSKCRALLSESPAG
jgi:uracil-DNA glycosylase